jgi:predicted DNA-binding transcriptional regulator YafY
VSDITADEAPERQGERAADLLRAASARKRVTFLYAGGSAPSGSRDVEPYGLFARDGRWYLVGRDTRAQDMRVFAVTRMSGLTVNPLRPKSSDFEPPAGFDVRNWMLLPFQFGQRCCEATLRFTGAAARRADAMCGGQGRLAARPDGSFVWTVPVADVTVLARWVVRNGPGIEVLAPDTARHAITEGLREVVSAHGD